MFPRCLDCFKKKALRPNSLGFQTPTIRSISTAEIATALRPFYFAVHPDLFGRHPEQRNVNEESLKHLSAHFEAIKQRRLSYNVPNVLKFYIRTGGNEKRDSFKLIQIRLERTQEPKMVIKKLLESCNLSTDYIETIKSVQNSNTQNVAAAYGSYRTSASPYGDIKYGSEFQDFEFTFREKSKNDRKELRSWLKNNKSEALARSKDLDSLKEEVSKLQKSLGERLMLKEVRYDCGWNYEHYRGCLKTLERLANMHAKHVDVLKGRIVVFAPFTGVSLEGHVMLFTGDVLNNWLDFIKNISKHDSFLKKIPNYETALSQVLRNIKIGRRKFMPKQQAVDYAGHLTKVTTNLLDYLTTNKFPKSWPEDLSDFEIVIESESGPLMVSPTGQLIAPSTCPGTILVDFITTHLEEAKQKMEKYNKHKHIEKELHQRCIEVLNLKSLTKDDSVTPDKMIQTLDKLILTNLKSLENIHLNITNYYSVLTDGTVCIPWDFELD